MVRQCPTPCPSALPEPSYLHPSATSGPRGRSLQISSSSGLSSLLWSLVELKSRKGRQDPQKSGSPFSRYLPLFTMYVLRASSHCLIFTVMPYFFRISSHFSASNAAILKKYKYVKRAGSDAVNIENMSILKIITCIGAGLQQSSPWCCPAFHPNLPSPSPMPFPGESFMPGLTPWYDTRTSRVSNGAPMS